MPHNELLIEVGAEGVNKCQYENEYTEFHWNWQIVICPVFLVLGAIGVHWVLDRIVAIIKAHKVIEFLILEKRKEDSINKEDDYGNQQVDVCI